MLICLKNMKAWNLKLEAREYAMEDKGYVETKSGKMKKADMLTKKMPVKKKGKMMKGKR
jgi:predicted RNA-binding protein